MSKSILQLFAFVLMSSVSIFSVAKVSVLINDTQYIYQQNPRLSDVLAPVAFTQPWYWPSSKLYREKSFSIEKVRRDTIFATSKYEQESDVDLSSLLTQLEDWQLAQRIKIPINFEHARFLLAKNPKFENGDYRLILKERPTTLHFFGALAEEQYLEYKDNACLADYLPRLKKIEAADKNLVYILPNFSNNNDMLAIKVPVAYWNEQCIIPMPGSSIYVPVQENQIFNQSARINQQVVSLAQNRVIAL